MRVEKFIRASSLPIRVISEASIYLSARWGEILLRGLLKVSEPKPDLMVDLDTEFSFKFSEGLKEGMVLITHI